MKKRIILIFVDGLGIGCNNRHNPLYTNKLEALPAILKEALPINAVLGVEGLPQSATGQTSLFCGINAQALIGHHVVGFPTPSLKKLIIEKNVFRTLSGHGFKSTFANGYWLDDIHSMDKALHRKMSVTTVAALHGIGEVRTADFLRKGRAVYQDITQELLAAKGADLPVITETDAARRLVRIAGDHDLTLFEYFQTDLAGHSRDPQKIRRSLAVLDAFLAALMKRVDYKNTALILTSDHGNIEDPSTSGHTRNPVPYSVRGLHARELREGVHGLDDVVPAIFRWFGVTR